MTYQAAASHPAGLGTLKVRLVLVARSRRKYVWGSRTGSRKRQGGLFFIELLLLLLVCGYSGLSD